MDELLAKVERLKELNEAEKQLISKALQLHKYIVDYKASSGPFICGYGGEMDSGGLYALYHVCPAYGSDYVAVYKRIDRC